jgi:hypothetical protein
MTVNSRATFCSIVCVAFETNLQLCLGNFFAALVEEVQPNFTVAYEWLFLTTF